MNERTDVNEVDKTPAPRGASTGGGKAAITLAQANQRLEQERKAFERALAREAETWKLQRAMSWVVIVMLPAVAIICVVIFFLHSSLPGEVVTAAAAAFFADIVGCLIAGYRSLIPRKPLSQIEPTTENPFKS